MKQLKLALGLTAMVATGAALAQTPTPYGSPVTLDMAKKCLAAGEDFSKKNNFLMAIAVVDTAGHLVAFSKMDQTQTASVRIAQEKAITAANFRRPSKVFEDAVKDRPAVLGLGVMPIEGGIPINIDGKIVGAVGASGGTAPQDGTVSRACLDALGSK